MITLNFNINVTGLAQNQFNFLKDLMMSTQAELAEQIRATYRSGLSRP